MLAVLTRTHTRSASLTRCIESVDSLRYRNQVSHVFLWDTESVGTGESHKFFNRVEQADTGLYVLILDDDDEIVYEYLVEDLIGHMHQGYPDAIFTKMDHGGGLGVLPRGFDSERFPIRGQVGISCPILSFELFQKVKGRFTTAYDGDFDFVRAAHSLSARPYYWDNIITRRQG